MMQGDWKNLRVGVLRNGKRGVGTVARFMLRIMHYSRDKGASVRKGGHVMSCDSMEFVHRGGRNVTSLISVSWGRILPPTVIGPRTAAPKVDS